MTESPVGRKKNKDLHVMRLCCAYEQTDGQGNEVIYSGTQNPLRVKTRAQTFGFVLSRVCQCHEIFVVLLGCC